MESFLAGLTVSTFRAQSDAKLAYGDFNARSFVRFAPALPSWPSECETGEENRKRAKPRARTKIERTTSKKNLFAVFLSRPTSDWIKTSSGEERIE